MNVGGKRCAGIDSRMQFERRVGDEISLEGDGVEIVGEVGDRAAMPGATQDTGMGIRGSGRSGRYDDLVVLTRIGELPRTAAQRAIDPARR